MEVQDQRRHILCGGAIEVPRGFITEQEPRRSNQRARDRHALAFPTRKLGGPVVDSTGESHLLHELSRPPCVMFTRRDQRRDEHVLENGTLREQAMILEDKSDHLVPKGRQLVRRELKWATAIEHDLPCRRRFKRAQDVQQRALPTSRWPHDGGGITGSERERHIAQNRQGAARCCVFFAETRDRETCGHSEGFEPLSARHVQIGRAWSAARPALELRTEMSL